MKYIVLAGFIFTTLGSVGVSQSFAKGASSLGESSEGVGLTLAEVRHRELQKAKKAKQNSASQSDADKRKKLNR